MKEVETNATAPVNVTDRKVYWAVVVTILLAALLVAGTNYALQAARVHDNRLKAQEMAQGWRQHFTHHASEFASLLERGEAGPEQAMALGMLREYGETVGISLFSNAGELVVSEGDVSDIAMTPGRLNQLQNLAAEDPMQTSVVGEREIDGAPGVAFISRFALSNEDGERLGAVELHTQQVTPVLSLANVTGIVALGVPLVSAFAFLLPMLIMIRINRKARLREMELANLSRQDALTGLMNRNGVGTKIRPLFAERRDPAEQIGIILIDLDNFKSINDVFSPAIGDAYLSETANRLLQTVRMSGFVGRMSGDEFIVVLPTITRKALRRFGEDLQHAIAEPVEIDGQTVICSACVGMHLSPVGEPVDRAFHAADVALNKAVSEGQGRTVEYFDALDQVTSRHNYIESYIRRVGFEKSIEVYYQPFVCVKTGHIVGFEALARMRDDEGQIIGPDDFIPVAESTGMIHELGMIVLRKAMRCAKKWPNHLYVSVNLSSVQFRNKELANEIVAEVDKLGLAPERLELELTESLLLSDEEGVSVMLRRLRDAGISIAMDDFGTGYSSLGYLWKYNFDKLKIDKSFLMGHDFEEERYFDIIETIILLGHKLGMSVTVEGVETRKQVDILTEMCCDQFQGYYFAKPLTELQVLALVNELCLPIAKSA